MMPDYSFLLEKEVLMLQATTGGRMYLDEKSLDRVEYSTVDPHLHYCHS